MKMSELVKKTKDLDAIAETKNGQNVYEILLYIFQNHIMSARFVHAWIPPSGMLKLVVPEAFADLFADKLKETGSEDLQIGSTNITIWRSSNYRGVIYCQGISINNIDEQWDDIIDVLKLRAESV